MSDLNESQQAAADKAQAEGFKVIRGKPTLLLIDLDTPEALVDFDTMFGRCAMNWRNEIVLVWWCRVGGRSRAIGISRSKSNRESNRWLNGVYSRRYSARTCYVSYCH